jgi:hypothetical protein
VEPLSAEFHPAYIRDDDDFEPDGEQEFTVRASLSK